MKTGEEKSDQINLFPFVFVVSPNNLGTPYHVYPFDTGGAASGVFHERADPYVPLEEYELAPALPSAYPSRILLAQASDRLPGWRDFAAIIDTSIARSPFWPGTERRSLERRVADVIVGAAMLATLPGVRDALTRQTGNERPPLMSFTVNTRARMGTNEANEDLIGMGSEASWSAPQKMAMAPASVSVEFGVRRIHHKRGLHRGVIQLRQEHGNFNEFAHAILMHSAATLLLHTGNTGSNGPVREGAPPKLDAKLLK